MPVQGTGAATPLRGIDNVPAGEPPATYGKAGSVTVYSTSSARRNANRSSFSALVSFIGLRFVVSRYLFFLPPFSIRSIASSSVATLPLWKYGADLLISSKVGV